MDTKSAEPIPERTDHRSEPVMLFGRDIRKIPCFKYSVLYGIYSGVGAGVATFLFTSRVRLATTVALGSYFGVSTAYWCYCRYNYVMRKYAINDMRQIMQQKYSSEETTEYLKEQGKLEDV